VARLRSVAEAELRTIPLGLRLKSVTPTGAIRWECEKRDAIIPAKAHFFSIEWILGSLAARGMD